MRFPLGLCVLVMGCCLLASHARADNVVLGAASASTVEVRRSVPRLRRATTAPHDARTKLERERAYEPYLLEAAKVYQVPVALLRAVLRVESDGDPHVVSRVGARGLMQLMPGTAREMGVDQSFDARENILGGARYLRVLANRWNGNMVLTIASYNAGPGAVERYRGVPPYKETRRYVRRVLQHYVAYRSGRRLATRAQAVGR